jgi:hypothetical protein
MNAEIFDQQAETVDPSVLDRKHQELREELSDNLAIFRHDPKKRAEFLARVDRFLEQVRLCVPEARTTTVSECISRIASEWQLAFTTELQYANDISDLMSPAAERTNSHVSSNGSLGNRGVDQKTC